MNADQVKKDMPAGEVEVAVPQHFMLCARMCEFKKCCKKYKHGDRCKKCPKRKDH